MVTQHYLVIGHFEYHVFHFPPRRWTAILFFYFRVSPLSFLFRHTKIDSPCACRLLLSTAIRWIQFLTHTDEKIEERKSEYMRAYVPRKSAWIIIIIIIVNNRTAVVSWFWLAHFYKNISLSLSLKRRLYPRLREFFFFFSSSLRVWPNATTKVIHIYILYIALCVCVSPVRHIPGLKARLRRVGWELLIACDYRLDRSLLRRRKEGAVQI